MQPIQDVNQRWMEQYLTEEIEKVQKRATKLVSTTTRKKIIIWIKVDIRKIINPWSEILNKLYDERVAPGLMQSFVSAPQGRDFELYKKVIKYNLRKYSFTLSPIYFCSFTLFVADD